MNDKLVKIHFNYNPLTGELIRKTQKNANGSYDKDGYLILKFKGKQYKAHRLAWLHYYGSFPVGIIDHKNRVRTDNRISNLRDTTQLVNVRNTGFKPNKNTGVIGVYFDKTKGLKKNYATRIGEKTKRFVSLEEAINARKVEGLQV